MKKIIVIALMAVMCLAFTSCGSDGAVLNPDADDPNLTDDKWALDIWNEAKDKLVANGEVQLSDEEGIIFQFENDQIAYSSPDVKAKYESSDFKIDEKTIWGDLQGSRTDAPAVFVNHSLSGEEDTDKPYYTSPYAVSPTQTKIFANTRGQCRYLAVVAGLCYDIDEEYYMGGIDRKGVSTYVFVFDAVEKEFVHIHFINSDKPGVTTNDPVGETYIDAAHEYMNKLCQ